MVIILTLIILWTVRRVSIIHQISELERVDFFFYIQQNLRNCF